LKANFYPDYSNSYKAAKLGPTEEMTDSKVNKIKGGMERGRKLDREIQRSIELIRKYKIPTRSLWEKSSFLEALKKIPMKTHRLWLRIIFNANTTQTKSAMAKYPLSHTVKQHLHTVRQP